MLNVIEERLTDLLDAIGQDYDFCDHCPAYELCHSDDKLSCSRVIAKFLTNN